MRTAKIFSFENKQNLEGHTVKYCITFYQKSQHEQKVYIYIFLLLYSETYRKCILIQFLIILLFLCMFQCLKVVCCFKATVCICEHFSHVESDFLQFCSRTAICEINIRIIFIACRIVEMNCRSFYGAKKRPLSLIAQAVTSPT